MSHASWAQYARALPVVPIDSTTQLISYRGTLPVPTLPAAELYGRAQEWLARQFEDYRSVVQFADATRGVLIGRAIVQAHAPAQKNQDARKFNVLFRFCFRVQNGALRYELTDISYPSYPVTVAAADAGSGLAADGLVGWLRQDEFSRLGTTATQTYRQPVEPVLRNYDQYTEKGAPKPRMLQQCQGIEEAMTTLLASLGQQLTSPHP
ncbi:DUF4468 domain-containing protein [Hymenobacter sp. HSC-4F20]|uniref:DUF4468 domain-containing protein n=1 Tax=Hymenobacter sp. HSC-4F20 TaxID=2864135 RepID=UPI001C7397A2|nr:DUF4468 domain-containing protein [Hymenobacter sp. HSC-4F20]MBX0292627.1 DUF4468 domain-containing protein [Hymenobacter sp. HSC-4F20]